MAQQLDLLQYKKQVVIFLDLLGIRDFIEHHEKIQQKQILDIYQVILNIIQFEYKEYKDDSGLSIDLRKIVSPHYAVSGLSDSIIITLDYEKLELLPILLRIVCIAQLIFIVKGVPIRGYITIGKCYHDKTTNMIFGGGLINAYIKERNDVNFPRVLIEEAIVHRLKKIFADKEVMRRLIRRYERTYSNMNGIDAFFLIASLNLKNSVAVDSTDKKWSTRLDPEQLLQDHYYGMLLEKNKTLRVALTNKLAFHKANYEKNNDERDRKIFEKWSYLHRMILPTLDRLGLQ